MTAWKESPPKHILLATDLGARCDRALDRAVQLAAQWNAKLTVVHALEPGDVFTDALPSWRRPKDLREAARLRGASAIRDVLPNAHIVIGEGASDDVVLRTAKELDCDLIVTGVARDEPFGRLVLGSTVDRLLRSAAAPVLVVRSRARRPYERIVVAVDFSVASRAALEGATRVFPDGEFTAFHAFDAPMSRLAGDRVGVRQQFRDAAAVEGEAFMAASDLTALRGAAPPLVLEYGAPDQLLFQYARDEEVDLVVLASHGRNFILDAIIGSVASALMKTLPCDALLMRAPTAPA